jgi:hypothetical protein
LTVLLRCGTGYAITQAAMRSLLGDDAIAAA